MDFSLKSKHGAFPVEVTIDEENHRFTVRNSDTTGEFFNSPFELVSWITENWRKEDFEDPEAYVRMLHEFQYYA